VKHKPTGPKHRTARRSYATAAAAIVCSLVGCEQDPYERAAECEAFLAEGDACGEAYSSIDECVADAPAHKPGTDEVVIEAGKITDAMLVAEAHQAYREMVCEGSLCKRMARELWSDAEQTKARACTLYLADFEKGKVVR